MTAIQSHLIPFDLPADKWSAYYEARLVLVSALNVSAPDFVIEAIVAARRHPERVPNLRFPVNPRLQNASQAIATSPASEAST